MKIFISYATEDVAVAGTLYGELAAAGAVVFQFGESETAGRPSWDEILAWIRECDVFILLVSKSSVKSRPVKEELICAHYSHINTDEKNPSKLIPAIIERGVDPPPLIQHFTRFDLIAIDTALPRLLKQLNLEKKASAAPATRFDYASLPDPTEMFQNHLRKNPKPSVASLWSEKAEKIVSNYHLLKPKEITSSVESSHLKTILRAQTDKGSKSPDKNPFAKYDRLFLGLAADSASADDTPPTTDKLSELLLTYDAKKPLLSSALPVPKVIATLNGFKWEPVAGASSYAVEQCARKDFLSPDEVYRGTDTSYETGLSLFGDAYYRVKAVGGVFRPDSAWSEAIRKTSIAHATSFVLPQLTAPKLQLKESVIGATLEWTTVEGASGYVLERTDGSFGIWSQLIYDGNQTSYLDLEVTFAKANLLRTEAKNPFLEQLKLTGKAFRVSSLAFHPPASSDASVEWSPVQDGMNREPRAYSYRVKAKAGLGRLDSDWSNIVRGVAGPPGPLDALVRRSKK